MPYGYIAKLPEGITREHVRFDNRYGTAIAADLYYAESLDQTTVLNGRGPRTKQE